MMPSGLSETARRRRMSQEDLRPSTLVLHDHVILYGIFELDREKRLPLEGPVI
jgi:hypothetical protein